MTPARPCLRNVGAAVLDEDVRFSPVEAGKELGEPPFGIGQRGFQLCGGRLPGSLVEPIARRVPLAIDPGMVVITDKRELEADLLGPSRVADEVARRVLLAAERVSDAYHGQLCWQVACRQPRMTDDRGARQYQLIAAVLMLLIGAAIFWAVVTSGG
jgi:hypothetical protein